MTMDDSRAPVGDPEDNVNDIALVPENDIQFFSLIQEACKSEDGKISVGIFLEELQRRGIQLTDKRLESTMKLLNKIKPHRLALDNLKLDSATFKNVVSDNTILINRSFQDLLIVPNFEDFCNSIEEIFNRCEIIRDGKNSDYLPQLVEADPDKWGVAICTTDGQRFSLGDHQCPFTMQSTSNILTYAICVDELGIDVVHKYQGREPSGRKFNEIALDYYNKPHNPLVNSGGIMSVALLLQLALKDVPDMASKYEYVHNFCQEMAGGEYVDFSNSSFLSERSSSDRNLALAYFMKENGCFPEEKVDVKRVMDMYFQLSSVEINCDSGSVIAATLANGGVCPATGKQVMIPDTVLSVRTLMYGCGMHNYSGKFAFDVGLPAKSGVSGVILVVIPGVMGICLYSPPLDKFGNSVRGNAFCKELVSKYHFHRFDDVGDNVKINPTLNKNDNPGKRSIQNLLAAAAGDLRFLQRSWFQGDDLNAGDYDGRTPLHVAAADGNVEVVKFLVNIAEVNPNPTDRWDKSPLDEAQQFNRTRVVRFLKKFKDSEEPKTEDGDNMDEDSQDEMLMYHHPSRRNSRRDSEDGTSSLTINRGAQMLNFLSPRVSPITSPTVKRKNKVN